MSGTETNRPTVIAPVALDQGNCPFAGRGQRRSSNLQISRWFCQTGLLLAVSCLTLHAETSHGQVGNSASAIRSSNHRGTTNAAVPAPMPTNQTRFEIPIDVHQFADRISEFQLLLSVDGGPWSIYQSRAPDQRAFEFQSRADGIYSFAMRTIDRNRQPNPPGPPSPEIVVIVDTQQPRLQLEAVIGQSGNVSLRWVASDPNLKPETLRLSYRAAGGMLSNGDAWNEIRVERGTLVRDGVLEGTHNWWPEIAANNIELKAEILDSASNAAVTTRRIEIPKVARQLRPQTPRYPNVDRQALRGQDLVNTSGPNGALPSSPTTDGSAAGSSQNQSSSRTPAASFASSRQSNSGLVEPAIDPRSSASTPPADSYQNQHTQRVVATTQPVVSPISPQRSLEGAQARTESVPPSVSKAASNNGITSGRTAGPANGTDGSGSNRSQMNNPLQPPRYQPTGNDSSTGVQVPSNLASGTPEFLRQSPHAGTPRDSAAAFNSSRRPSSTPTYNELRAGGSEALTSVQEPVESVPSSLDDEVTPTDSRPAPTESSVGNYQPATPLSNHVLPPGEYALLTNRRQFRLTYEIDAVRPESVDEVTLWMTRDGGNSWEDWGTDSDRMSPFPVQVPTEGIFGFKIVVASREGFQGQEPLAGDLADVWVEVDMTKPQVELVSAPLGTGPNAGKLVIEWRASDHKLASRPISLYYSESLAGPWSLISAGLENTGTYTWKIDAALPQMLFLRVEARDRAENISHHDLSTPVDLRRLNPTGRILGFDQDATTEVGRRLPLQAPFSQMR